MSTESAEKSPAWAAAASGRQRRVVLASGSPRRLDILRAHGINPDVLVPDVDESDVCAPDGSPLAPEQLVMTLARRKAWAVWQQLAVSTPLMVLAADTIVYKPGVGVLGKPLDRTDAIRMLELLRNTSHQVFTGVALLSWPSTSEHDSTSPSEIVLYDLSTVHFGDYTLADIEDFLLRDPPYDKAGSYAAQGMWAAHITRIDGDRENVIGLPWQAIASYLC
ncbi:MAG: Maf family protein [Coriobacteriales bacterium]|jgi:septum formation protein|nr:Maf family protein [Coriobacteriales bacterium]